ncbi:DsbA family protein [Pseudomonas sp. EL_65y_Pfl2_R95]|uniref:DsbA family protein n=1 Tax=Pseudomonas sp. EL_65y_Pfl2_R95 TaxID=3088698 RepID=UPI0030D717FD
MKLIFVADPMCSWCYGFAKELSQLTQAYPELPIEIVVGGVRAGETAILDDAGKRFRLEHWERVEKLSGLPFNRDAFKARETFVYNTEPICRAVVTVRRLAPEANLLNVFRALQNAFYRDGRNTIEGEVLANVASDALAAEGIHLDEGRFLAGWQDETTVKETAADFIKARRWGIYSFPALLLDVGSNVHVLSPGYASAADLQRNLEQVLAHASTDAVVQALDRLRS